MYDELVKTLRLRAALWEKMYDEDNVLKQAADAIEELSKKFASEHKLRVKALNRLCSWCGVCSKENRDAVGCDDIAQLDEVRTPRWISVEERLPDSGVPTLICGDGNVVEQGFFDDEFGYWYGWGGNRTFAHHWMQLPEPPKEANNGE